MTREDIIRGKTLISQIETLQSKLKTVNWINDRSDEIEIRSSDKANDIRINGAIKAEIMQLLIGCYKREIENKEAELAAL